MADEDRAIDTVVIAFAADPVTRWTWPEAHQYLAAMASMARAFGGPGFPKGGGHCIDGYAGVALWLPPNVHVDDDALGAVIERTVPASRHAEIFALFEQMAVYHPTEPHWYLPLIGVDPAHQGKGYGSALMAYALEQCDRDHVPAYLESTNPRNIPLYRRHGFETLGTIQSGSSPSLVPMLRQPR